MHGVSQRIENGSIVLGNARIQLDDVRPRDLYEIRERTVLIDPDDTQVLADVRLSQPALAAMPAVDVHLCTDKIPWLDRRDFIAHALDVAAKFVSQRQRRLDASLRPVVPPVNVQ